MVGSNVGVALGNGGARGFAYLGARRALRERGNEPVAISKASIGGIVGALGERADPTSYGAASSDDT